MYTAHGDCLREVAEHSGCMRLAHGIRALRGYRKAIFYEYVANEPQNLIVMSYLCYGSIGIGPRSRGSLLHTEILVSMSGKHPFFPFQNKVIWSWKLYFTKHSQSLDIRPI